MRAEARRNHIGPNSIRSSRAFATKSIGSRRGARHTLRGSVHLNGLQLVHRRIADAKHLGLELRGHRLHDIAVLRVRVDVTYLERILAQVEEFPLRLVGAWVCPILTAVFVVPVD